MADIQPFAALRYNTDVVGRDWSELIAPPYDILEQADKDRLLAVNDRNVVAVDLPYVPPKAAGPAELYQAANGALQRWIGEKVLIVESVPAIYVYHQTFTYEGRSYRRRKFFVRLRLEAFGEGSVFPHEQTFGGPKEDRLALMKATVCQLSPIFGMYKDPANEVANLFDPVTRNEPHVVASMDGVENHIWIATDPALLARAKSMLADKRIFIADGHHRYATALMYRDGLAERRGGDLPPDHPARFVLMVLCGMEDPGCLILPTHRVWLDPDGVSMDELMRMWAEGVEPCAQADAELTVVHGPSGSAVHVRFSNRAALDTLAPQQSAAWRSLDLAYLHRFLFDELLTRGPRRSQPPKIGYFKTTEGAVEAAKQAGGFAFLVRPTTMRQLRDVSEAGDLMPQKSTYFYPKLATGMVINPLA